MAKSEARLQEKLRDTKVRLKLYVAANEGMQGLDCSYPPGSPEEKAWKGGREKLEIVAAMAHEKYILREIVAYLGKKYKLTDIDNELLYHVSKDNMEKVLETIKEIPDIGEYAIKNLVKN